MSEATPAGSHTNVRTEAPATRACRWISVISQRGGYIDLMLRRRTPLPPKWVFEPWMGRGGEAWEGGPLPDAAAEQVFVLVR